MLSRLHDGNAVTPGDVEPVRDRQSVLPDGTPVRTYIDGVKLHPLTTHTDDRGTLTELFRHSWGVHADPLVYAKLITIRPGKIKGWVMHRLQDDRLTLLFGAIQVVLYDDRLESPTHGMVNDFCLGEHGRTLFTIPAGVYHALRCVGSSDAVLVNLPTNIYSHEQPDKYRLPLVNDRIPYRFG